jgi:chitin-binding protein
MLKPTLLLGVTACAVAAVGWSSAVQAHGYVTKPASRGYLCRQGENTQCGNVVYEPQSLEGPDRYPASGPADGTLAAAGLTAFAPLNEQTASRWRKQPLSAGTQTFSWRFTAAHSSRDWRYFITKADWNPNLPLSRSQFEPTPFCQVDGQNRQPPMQVSHQCTVPQRTGYQVILAVWDVADTPMSFYNVIDVQMQAAGPVQPVVWQDVGDLYTERQLQVGDKVVTRVFSAQGEISALNQQLVINSVEEGEPTRWPGLLAAAVKQAQSQYQIGVLQQDQQIKVQPGKNEIYASSDSGISRVEIQHEQSPPPLPHFAVQGVERKYQLDGKPLEMKMMVDIGAAARLNVSLNQGDQAVATTSQQVEAGLHAVTLLYPQPVAGHYSLTVHFLTATGAASQKTFHLDLIAATVPTDPTPDPKPDPVPGSYDYVFGQNLKAYRAGTKVLQSKNGRIYQCKPWPYNGYCVQWSTGATQYEPGIGTHWQMAWTLLP